MPLSGTVSLEAGVSDGTALGVAVGALSSGWTGEGLGAADTGVVSAGAEGVGEGDGVAMMAPSASVRPYLAPS